MPQRQKQGGSQPKVFLSHSHRDRHEATRLQKVLTKYGADTYLDQDQIQAGDRLPQRIREGIESSDIFLLLWSSSAAASQWVQREWDLAFEERRKIIPYKLDDTDLPEELEDRVYVESSDQDRAHVGLLKAVFGSSFKPSGGSELFPGPWIADVDAGVSQGTYELELRDNGQIEGVCRLSPGGPFAELIQSSGVGHIWATPIPIRGSWTYDDRTQTLTLDIIATGFGTKSQDTIRVRATGRERGAIQGTDFAGRAWTLRRAEGSTTTAEDEDEDEDAPVPEKQRGGAKTRSGTRSGAARSGRAQQDSGPTSWDVDVVREVVAEYCDVSTGRIDVRKPLGDQGLQLDDLDLVEIVMAIESRTSMSLPDGDLDSSADTASVYSLAGALARARSG